MINELLGWYGENKRELPWRQTDDPYKIWLSEVMLQQTRVATVIPYYHRFLDHFPTLEALASAEEQTVLKLWEGLGYYNRCHHFLRAAKEVCQRFGGRVPSDPELFRELPGVGPYTLAAVMSIAFGHPLAVVDGNVIRVVTRFFLIEDDITRAAVKKRIGRIMAGLVPPEAPGEFNQAMMELGATVCTPKTPGCCQCPLNRGCAAFGSGQAESLPFKPPKPKVPVYPVALALIARGGRFLIQKRPSAGHLAGMWEFPGGRIQPGETPEEALDRRCREELGVPVRGIRKIAVASHGYTHFKVRLTLFLCTAPHKSIRPLKNQSLAWITLEELDHYPFPAANHKLFLNLKKQVSDFLLF